MVGFNDLFFNFCRASICRKSVKHPWYIVYEPPKKNNLANDLWVQNGANKRLEFQIHVYSVENIVTHHMFTKTLIADLGHGIL